ncbi:carboxypeptidase-like regulatory domain-containing protein [Candidatus Laterigemmans baculatus]|uniref:carboxypeptidase-like regulatory domain-containing protein n=1 Tax=Candidatus Laterigemmans baculatus TaxID=2770505 RepID=UPI0013DD1184|nr:carboxypeptidase-like regulatory domain-containing protein [Candidatus Laterigemmans baculatus]
MRAFLAAILGALVFSPTLATADEAVAAPSPDSHVASQWVQPDANGNVYIKVFAPADPSLVDAGRVALFDVTGQPLPAELNAEGLFVVRNVYPGVYRLSYRSAGSYSARSLTVVAPGQGGRELPSTTSITASSLRPERALSTIARYQPARIDADAVPREGELPLPEGTPIVPDGYQVVQSPEGGLAGRLFRSGWLAGGMVPAANVNVLVIRSDEVVGQAVTAVDGSFAVPNLSPGVYDLIASGSAGFAATGFELIAPPEAPVDEPLAASKNPFRAASAVMQAGGFPFELQLAPPSTNLLGEESFGVAGPDGGLAEDGGLAPPLMDAGFAPGGFAGGGFGPGGGFGGGGAGGGGLGGGGGFGAFAAIGGAIAAAAIAASDDDDLAIPVASP